MNYGFYINQSNPAILNVMLCLYRYSYSDFMVAVVIRAGRLLEHVMRLAALSPVVNAGK